MQADQHIAPAERLPRFATRLNSFRGKPELCWGSPDYRPSVAEMIVRAGGTRGLHELELNFPDHLEGSRPEEIVGLVQAHGLKVNGLAMRYYKDPAYRLGAFTHPDAAVRRRAIDPRRRLAGPRPHAHRVPPRAGPA